MLAGSLDTSFGAGGTIYTLAGMGGASEVAAQTGGKIIVGAHVLGAGKAVLVRYNADGSIDASFGSDGVIVFNTGAAFLVQADGTILAKSGTGIISAFTPDGVPDTGFALPEGDAFNVSPTVAIQADGKRLVTSSVVVAYTSVPGWDPEETPPFLVPTDIDVGIYRFDANGIPDPTFGQGGTVVINVNGVSTSGYPVGIAALPSGKILLATTNELVRFNSDGSLDTGFGSGGIVTFALLNQKLGGSGQMLIQPDGKIVFVGGDDDVVVARFTPDGVLDGSFDGDGVAEVKLPGHQHGMEVDLLPDGSLIVAGPYLPFYAPQVEEQLFVMKFFGAGTGQVVAGTGSNDLLVGTSDNDTITGDAGSDTINPGAGNDSVLGGDGGDVAHGGSNNDSMHGGFGNDYIRGGHGDDMLIGNEGGDSLFGAVGADYIHGAQENDLLRGNQGNDSVFGGGGDDDVAGGLENDRVVGGEGDDLLSGGSGKDFLGSGYGDDTADGGEGDDTLRGGPGHDQLTGGLGADRFIFAHAGGIDSDTITDFVAADGDVIELGSGSFPALAASGTLSPAQFGSLVLYDTGSGALSYDADGAGGTAPLLIVTLAGAPALAADDVLVS